MRNTKAFDTAHLKWYLMAIGILLIAFGYYGQFYVPSQTSYGMQSTGFCPLGRGSLLGGGSSYGVAAGGPCAGALEALLIGIALVAIPIATIVFKR